MEMRLSDEELAAVVQRAHEIHSLQERVGGSERGLEDYVRVAEEMGVPREAMMQALNERFTFLDREIEPGLLVFAKSGDGRSYPAKVVSSAGGSVHLRFLNGGDGRAGRHELHEASFTPGTVFEYHSPSYSMYVRAQVVRYDRDAMTVTFNYWGTEETVPLAKVRMPRPRTGPGVPPWLLTLATAVGSGIVGALLTWLIMST